MKINHNQFAWQTLRFPLLFAALIVAFSGCKKNDDNTPTPKTIFELLATGNGTTSQFTLLKKAIVRAGISAQFTQPGTYTLFAPTDAAFKLLGPAYADTNAINAINPLLLQQVLLYHVLTTTTASSAIPTALLTPVTTSAGSSVYVSKVASSSVGSASISVNGARIVSADNQASNGVIHVIDRVLVPPAFGDLVKTIQGIPTLFPTASFTFLQAAVVRVGAVSSLTGTTPLTVFAPTDAAFTAAVPSIKSVADINALPMATLNQILSYHIVAGRVYTPLISNTASLTTLQGGTLSYVASTTALTVTGKGNGGTASNITFPDITATNGVVNIIDRLLLPQ